MFPKINLDNFLRKAAADIIIILPVPPSSTTLSLQAGDVTRNAFLDLVTTLNRTDKLPILHPTTTEPQRVQKSPNDNKATVTTVGTQRAQRVKNIEEKTLY